MMSRLAKTILLTGLFVGTTDLLSAFITVWVKTGKFFPQLLNYIAAGLLGLKTAMAGGSDVAFLGLFLHYFIAMCFTVFFFIVFKYFKFLSFNKYLIGVLYAVFVNLVMEQGILRLTTLPIRPFSVAYAFITWVILGITFGIPIVYNAYKYYGTDQQSSAI